MGCPQELCACVKHIPWMVQEWTPIQVQYLCQELQHGQPGSDQSSVQPCTLPVLQFHSRFPEELVRTRKCPALSSWIEYTAAQPPAMCCSGTSWARGNVFTFSSCSWTLGWVCSPRDESTLLTGVQLCQLTNQCPTGATVLDKWHVLHFPFI